MAQTEYLFEADIIGTNLMGGVPCPPPHILANVLSQGANVFKIVTTWYPKSEGRTIMCVYVDNEIDQMGPQQAFDGSLFQFQKVTRNVCSSPTSITENVNVDSKEESKQSQIEFNIHTLKSSVGETSNTIKILKGEFSKLESKISSKTNKLKKLEEQIEYLEKKNKNLYEENENLIISNKKLKKSNEDRRKQKKILKSENLALEKENQKLRDKNNNIDCSINKMIKEKEKYNFSKKSMDKELKQLENQIENKLIQYNKLENQSESISEKVVKMNDKSNKIKEEIKKENEKLGLVIKYIEGRESLGKSLSQAITMQQKELEDLKKEVKITRKSVSTFDLIKETAIYNLEECHYLTGFKGKNIVETVVNIRKFIQELAKIFGKDFC